MSYISASDITDTIINGFDDISDYITLSDEAVENVARKRGIMDSDDIETDPVDYNIKQYAIAWVLMRMCLDKSGQNDNITSSDEKYMYKYDMYRQQVARWEKSLTPEMFLGTVSVAANTAPTSPMIYRG